MFSFIIIKSWNTRIKTQLKLLKNSKNYYKGYYYWFYCYYSSYYHQKLKYKCQIIVRIVKKFKKIIIIIIMFSFIIIKSWNTRVNTVKVVEKFKITITKVIIIDFVVIIHLIINYYWFYRYYHKKLKYKCKIIVRIV